MNTYTVDFMTSYNDNEGVSQKVRARTQDEAIEKAESLFKFNNPDFRNCTFDFLFIKKEVTK